jgi:hypothetical protein
MPIYKKGEEEEKPKEETTQRSFKSFIKSEKTKKFISKCHKKYNVTEAGTRELLYELYQRYGGDGDDDDEDKVRERAEEMLDVMKSVADKFALFKKD